MATVLLSETEDQYAYFDRRAKLSTKSPQSCTSEYPTPLMIATRYGHDKIAELLLDFGDRYHETGSSFGDIIFDAINCDGITVLHIAVMYQHWKIVEIICDHLETFVAHQEKNSEKMIIHYVNRTYFRNRETAFIMACKNKNYRCINTLLKCKYVNVMARDDMGKTGLEYLEKNSMN